eukprot:gnl/MRDRNA2_/MRDRNA2_315882_c0_seq1.p1 gnl/MRDRNA2_/MRDRNA2_315882_c0~~gnl/MRDRNA2_/MRDRNA2_315882_c0_seq1.p1  ORF type:complete len:225 (+),score=43.49 gnl/MRDRNA2_/MRDRNA2_315882_c0_seq1:128-802(+)
MKRLAALYAHDVGRVHSNMFYVVKQASCCWIGTQRFLHFPATISCAGIPRSLCVRWSERSGKAAGGRERTWWDYLLHGKAGKPTPPPPVKERRDLRLVFNQWDRNNNGVLESKELANALKAVGLRGDAISEVFDALGVDRTDHNCRLTFEEFDTNLPPGVRSAIEEKLNDEGVMDSLYVPPELWEDDRTASEVQWDLRMQYEAQRSGNALRQNDILSDELRKNP